MIRRPPRSTRVRSSAASDVYKRQLPTRSPRTAKTSPYCGSCAATASATTSPTFCWPTSTPSSTNSTPTAAWAKPPDHPASATDPDNHVSSQLSVRRPAVSSSAATDPWTACDWSAHSHRPRSSKSDSRRVRGRGVIANLLLNRMQGGVHRADETRRDEHHQHISRSAAWSFGDRRLACDPHVSSGALNDVLPRASFIRERPDRPWPGHATGLADGGWDDRTVRRCAPLTAWS